VWVADSGASPTLGAVTATWASTRQGAGLIVGELSGTDLSVSALTAIIQKPTNSGAGTTGSVTLAAAEASGNRPVGIFAHAAATLHALTDANWVEFHDASFATPDTAMQVQWRSGAFASPSTSWTTSSAWVGIALEVDATGPIGGVVLSVTPTLPAGAVTNVLAGVALTITPSLPAARVDHGLTGVVLTVTPTLPAGDIPTTVTLTGVVLTVTPSLPVGSLDLGVTGGYLGGYVTYGYTGSGAQNVVQVVAVILSITPSLPAGRVDHSAITGAVLTVSPSLPAGSVFIVVSIIDATVLTVTPQLPPGFVSAPAPSGYDTGYVRSTEM